MGVVILDDAGVVVAAVGPGDLGQFPGLGVGIGRGQGAVVMLRQHHPRRDALEHRAELDGAHLRLARTRRIAQEVAPCGAHFVVVAVHLGAQEGVLTPLDQALRVQGFDQLPVNVHRHGVAAEGDVGHAAGIAGLFVIGLQAHQLEVGAGVAAGHGEILPAPEGHGRVRQTGAEDHGGIAAHFLLAHAPQGDAREVGGVQHEAELPEHGLDGVDGDLVALEEVAVRIGQDLQPVHVVRPTEI